MAKDPAFPFYASDFLTDTMRWTREMKSLHVDLLAESWLNGGLSNHGSTAVQPEGNQHLNHDYPEGLTEADQKIWLRIKSKWELIDGMWFNRKLEEVREKRNKFLKRQSDKGKASAEARKNKPSASKNKLNRGSTVVEPIENEKENEKEKELEIEVGNHTEYPEEMRRAFLSYWTEPDRRGKQRWKREETWETSRRLARWHSNNLSRQPSKPSTKPIEPQKVTGPIKF